MNLFFFSFLVCLSKINSYLIDITCVKPYQIAPISGPLLVHHLQLLLPYRLLQLKLSFEALDCMFSFNLESLCCKLILSLDSCLQRSDLLCDLTKLPRMENNYKESSILCDFEFESRLQIGSQLLLDFIYKSLLLRYSKTIVLSWSLTIVVLLIILRV